MESVSSSLKVLVPKKFLIWWFCLLIMHFVDFFRILNSPMFFIFLRIEYAWMVTVFFFMAAFKDVQKILVLKSAFVVPLHFSLPYICTYLSELSIFHKQCSANYFRELLGKRFNDNAKAQILFSRKFGNHKQIDLSIVSFSQWKEQFLFGSSLKS